VLLSFTRVDCEVVGNNVCQTRRGMQHRLPLRVSHEHRTLQANGRSRGPHRAISLSVPCAGESLLTDLKPSQLAACARLSFR
jgi:hypothetical protein